MQLKKCKGYLLLEALIAVAIFSIGLLGIAMTQLNMSRQTSHAKYRAEAQNIINSAIMDMQANSENEKCYLTDDSCGDNWRTRAKTMLGNDDNNYSVSQDDDGKINITISWSIPSEKTYQGNDIWHHVDGSYVPITGKIE